MNHTEWKRVSKARRCPVCDKPDWCLYAGDDDAPTAAICQRVESPKRAGEGGWLHRLRDDLLQPKRRTVRTVALKASDRRGIDWGLQAKAWASIAHPGALRTLADRLGLSVQSLRRLEIGWSTSHLAWTFPMKDARGRVVGIRLRRPDGSKLSVKGGKEGLFIPEDLAPGDWLLICEGPTDCAALLDLGFAAVGRPSCTGGTKHLADLVRRRRISNAVMVADGDTPGQRGADRLAAILSAYCPAVRVLTPPAPHKDARAWKWAGATAADVASLIEATSVRRLAVEARKAGGKHGRR